MLFGEVRYEALRHHFSPFEEEDLRDLTGQIIESSLKRGEKGLVALGWKFKREVDKWFGPKAGKWLLRKSMEATVLHHGTQRLIATATACATPLALLHTPCTVLSGGAAFHSGGGSEDRLRPVFWGREATFHNIHYTERAHRVSDTDGRLWADRSRIRRCSVQTADGVEE